MSSVLITGSGGLIGSESALFFSAKGFHIIGIDNDMRQYFFGASASTKWNVERLRKNIVSYDHREIDIRNQDQLENVFKEYASDIALVIHTAAQPSHDWAAKEPFTDFGINANGTLNMLEFTRRYCPKAVFIFTSTNKVYGDTPNSLPLVETETRWEIDSKHPFYNNGINETMSIDQSKHSLFGASKVAADILVQEYGRYFNMHTVCFRGGCLTGPNHSGTQLHGFLSYLVQCAITETPYTIFGYKGKQVRDNIHSYDLVSMFWHFFQNHRVGEVYNAGGSRHSNCSMMEAIHLCEEMTGKPMQTRYVEENRSGDHIWWISDVGRFREHYPSWFFHYDIRGIIEEITKSAKSRV